MGKSHHSLIFFSTGCPWPTYTGYGKRIFNLLVELARVYPIDLRILTREPLSQEQRRVLEQYAETIMEIPRRDALLRDKLSIVLRSIVTRAPFHVSIVEHSFDATPALSLLRPTPSDRVFAAHIYWASGIRQTAGKHWIIDQTNADVHFWELYAQERQGFWRWLAKVNAKLTCDYCKQVYTSAACVLAVCNEDRELTMGISPLARVEVVPNGVDCSYFVGDRTADIGIYILFTGTSVPRNMYGLRWFVRDVYPTIRSAVPDVRFLVAGNFDSQAQRELAKVPGILFTGKQPDLRSAYNRSAVFINPFAEAYGSKLKIAEALAMGICIVSMPSGVRGFPLVDNESVLLARDSEEFARQVIRALDDAALRNRIGCAGRVVAETYLDWERVIGPCVREIAESVLGSA